ncbi:hypothetical protein [Streptomyces sp. SP18BB07]|uniref:hypothetical protein n=1 Tax=Streptomyces sp. SP18BB07 TaxID=3002522 RepID=UPI002E79AB0B|nr:hypothetical protein [Streptomyces sp. SP18BB07]MEE1764436.1 hypothetical protein [Streptomyces sp. SP18BB07]
MATPTDVLAPALASDISDRAFRVLHVLALHTDGGWTAVPVVAAKLGMKPHQVRGALAELCTERLAEKDRRYELGDTGRKTWHTYFRLVDDNATEDAA